MYVAWRLRLRKQLKLWMLLDLFIHCCTWRHYVFNAMWMIILVSFVHSLDIVQWQVTVTCENFWFLLFCVFVLFEPIVFLFLSVVKTNVIAADCVTALFRVDPQPINKYVIINTVLRSDFILQLCCIIFSNFFR